MPLDLTQFTVQRIVLHKVLRRENRIPVAPIYGNGLVDLGREGLATLQNRMVKALGSDSHGIEMAITHCGRGSFYETGATLINSVDQDFVVQSRAIADMLNEAQATRDLPGGAVVVMNGITGNMRNRFLSVIKAETHDGFDLLESDRGLTAEYLANLMLTPAQRFYKIGFLIETNYNQRRTEGDASNFAGYLYDHLMNAKETRPAAQYFHRDFLGFELLESSKKVTRDFYMFTKEFITGRDLPPEKKLDLYDSLYVTLKVDQSPTISLSQYADTYFSFEDDLRDDYLQFMESKNVPVQAINKDLSLITHYLKRRKVKFTNDITIIAPAEGFSDLVKIEDSNEESTLVRIKGKLKTQE